MKLLYFHDRLLRDIYRCAQVRTRLQHFIQNNPVDMILISTQNRSFNGFKSFDFLKSPKQIPLIESQEQLTIEGIHFYKDSLIIKNQIFKPVDGMIFLIETEPHLSATAFFMDLFADERFKDYHSDLSEDQIVELQVELKKKTKYN